MNARYRTPIWILLALAVQGCATAHIVTQRDPTLPPDHYQALLVDASLGNLAESQSAERRLASTLVKRGYLSFAEEELFFPQREYSDEDIASVLDDHGVDAVLVLRVRDAGYESSYVPRTVQTQTWVTTRKGRRGETTRVDTKTTERGGYDVERPWADYVAELRDRESGELVWYAELQSEGQFGWGHDFEDLARAAADRLAAKLREDRMLARQPKAAEEKELPIDESSKPLRLRRRSY